MVVSSKLPVDRGGGGRRGDALASSLRRPRGQTDSGEGREERARRTRTDDSLEEERREGERRRCKSDSLSPRSSERRSALPLAVAPSAQTASASDAPDVVVVAALARAHILERAQAEEEAEEAEAGAPPDVFLCCHAEGRPHVLAPSTVIFAL